MKQNKMLIFLLMFLLAIATVQAKDFAVRNQVGAPYLFVNGSSGNVGVGVSNSFAQFTVPGVTSSHKLSVVSTTTIPSGDVGGLIFIGNYAYLTGSNGDLFIYDFSNLLNPELLGSVNYGTSPGLLAVQGKYAYAPDYGTSKLYVIDISDVGAPVVVGSLATAIKPIYIKVQSTYAYVLATTNGVSDMVLYKIDISDPTNPVLNKTLALGASYSHNNARPFDIQGDQLFVTGHYSQKCSVVDISNDNLDVIAEFTLPDQVLNLNVLGRYAYVNTNYDFYIYDISNISSVSSVGSISFGGTAISHGLKIVGRYAYITELNTNNLDVYDISDPTNIQSIDKLSITSPGGVEVNGRYAYVASSGDIIVVDVGGAFIQQAEIGGLKVDDLNVRSNSFFNRLVSIAGGLTVGEGINVNGPSSINGNVKVNGSLCLGGDCKTSWPSGTSQWTTTGSDIYYNDGNVGIGTTDPQTKLEVKGSGIWNAAGASAISLNNAVANQVFEFHNDDSGNFQIADYTNGKTRFFITPGNSADYNLVIKGDTGNVGIGTNDPQYKLDVQSTNTGFGVNFGSTSQSQYSDLSLTSDTGNAQLWKAGSGYGGYGGASSLNIYNSENAPIVFFQETNERMRINTGGNVGIGITDPQYKLDVDGTINFAEGSWIRLAGGAFIGNTAANHQIYVGATDLSFRKYANGDPLATILDNGNVGIGTDDPQELLHVYRSNTGTTPARFKLQTANSNSFYITEWGYADGNSASMIGQNRYWDDSGNEQRADTSKSAWALLMSTISGADDIISFQHVASNGIVTYPLSIKGDSGNVGIGTSDPQVTLDIQSTDGVVSTQGAASHFPRYNLKSGSGSLWTIGTQDDYASNSLIIAPDMKYMYKFTTDGRFGIGLADGDNPDTSLHVQKSSTSGDSGVSPTIRVDNTNLNQEDGASTYNIASIRVGSGYNTGTKASAVDFGISTEYDTTYSGASLYTVSNHPITIATNQVERMRITADGNVGIGTSNPRSSLQVGDSIKGIGTIPKVFFSNEIASTNIATVIPSLGLGTGSVSGPGTRIRIGFYHPQNIGGGTDVIAATIDAVLEDNTGNWGEKASISFNTQTSAGSEGDGLTERMRVNYDGNVGIGTTDPQTLLHVSGSNYIDTTFTSSSAVSSGIMLDSTGSGGRQYSLLSTADSADSGGGKFGIYDDTSNVYRVVVDSSGNVGIGTTTPSVKLDVVGDIKSNSLSLTPSIKTNPNLVSYWSMDNNWNDYKGTNNGALNGAVTFSTPKVGLASASFPGSDSDHISVAHTASLNPTDITIEGWIKPTASTTGHIFDHGGNSGYRFRINPNYTLSFITSGSNSISTTATCPINHWCHVVATGDASGLKIYLNGVLSASNGVAFNNGGQTDTAYIGRSFHPGEYFKGLIDEVAIYNTSLSQNVITSHYNNYILSVDGNAYFKENVGIGTDFPKQKLDVNGNINLYNSLSVIGTDALFDLKKISYSDQVLATSGLIGYWKFDGNADDSLKLHNGTLSGTTFSTSNYGQGANFNGIDSSIQLSNGENIIPVNDFTISAWVNIPSNQAGSIIIQSTGYRFNIYVTVNKIQVIEYPYDGWPPTTSLISNKGLSFNNWHNIVVTKSSTDGRKIYIDGVLDNYDSVTDDWERDGGNADYVGKGSTGTSFFNGSIDELSIINRTLSDSEILSLYQNTDDNDYSTLKIFNSVKEKANLGVNGKLNVKDNICIGYTCFNELQKEISPDANTVLLMHFNKQSEYGEDSSNVHDFSGNGNDGVVYGDAIWNSSGRFGGAYNFDGVDDYIDLGDTNNPGSLNYTLSFWINLKSNDTSQQILGKSYGNGVATGNQFEVLYSKDYGIIFYGIEADSGNVIRNKIAPFEINKWYHVVLILDRGSQQLLFYKNGVLQTWDSDYTQNDGWPYSISNTRPFRIGITQNLDSSFNIPLNGSIDEVAIWDKALSASEVNQIYQDSKSNFVINNSNNDPVNYQISGSLKVNGSVSFALQKKTTNYTITSNDKVILINASVGNLIVTLPNITGISGRAYTIKKIDSSIYNVTIKPNSTELIDGQVNLTFSTQYQSYDLITDGTQWWIT